MDGIALALKSSEIDKSGDARGGEGVFGNVRLLIEQEQRDPVLGLGQVVGQFIVS